VDQFNHRRYQRELPNGQQQMQQSVEKSASDPYGQEESDFEPVDNCLASVLSQEIELTDEFKANYGLWLHRECTILKSNGNYF